MDINIPQDILKAIFSNPNKDSKYIKGKINKIGELYQVSLFTDKQAFHKNYSSDEINNQIISLFDDFSNLEIFTKDYVYGYRLTKKGKLLTNKRKNNELINVEDHNRNKNYLLDESMIIPALIDLGVTTPDGRVVKAKYDKYRQINRFLEIINDSIGNEKKLKIIDFGCGKSYLTFILYYYLYNVKKIDVDIIGLDLKSEVIKDCNKISEKYGYQDHLKFIDGNIKDFNEKDNIDMIITLHACDTATDYALYYAINMKCRYIFSVPCCQKEINSQLDSSNMHFMNKFGIIKERYSSLLTDSIRANILQYYGYKTQILEFVDFDATPKNLLIRASLTNNGYNKKVKEEIDEVIKALNIKQTLYELAFEKEEA